MNTQEISHNFMDAWDLAVQVDTRNKRNFIVQIGYHDEIMILYIENLLVELLPITMLVDEYTLESKDICKALRTKDGRNIGITVVSYHRVSLLCNG